MTLRGDGCRLALLALLLSGPTRAAAQEYIRTVAATSGSTQICVTWNQRTYTYRIDSAGSVRTPGDTEFGAVQAAFGAWQALADTCSDFKFIRGANIDNPTVGHGSSDTNVVTFREKLCSTVVPQNDPCYSDDTCGNAYHCWDHSDGTIALTTVTYSTKTGIAVDADVELNAADFLMTAVASPPCDEGKEDVTCVAYDIQNTMTHEIGHVVGFAHVLSDSSSLMFPTAPLGETSKRVIDVGTAAGFCTTYPKHQPPLPCDPAQQLQRKVIATTTCSAAGDAPSWLGLALALLVARLRRPT